MKDADIRIRLSAEEKAVLQAAADRDQRSLSDWVRVTALKAAKEKK